MKKGWEKTIPKWEFFCSQWGKNFTPFETMGRSGDRTGSGIEPGVERFEKAHPIPRIFSTDTIDQGTDRHIAQTLSKDLRPRRTRAQALFP